MEGCVIDLEEEQNSHASEVKKNETDIPGIVYHIDAVASELAGEDLSREHDSRVTCNASRSENVTKQSLRNPAEESGIGILKTVVSNRNPALHRGGVAAAVLEQLPGLPLMKAEGAGGETRAHCCPICKKYFKHGSHLKRHVNTHTKEKSYECKECSKTFADASSLTRHQRTHSGDKPWGCKVCNKAFGALGSLRRHVTVHNPEARPYVCSTCSLRFPDNSSYRKHVFIHTGIKPYVCDICGKSFVHVGDMNGHRKLHIGWKPFKCAQCGSEFAKHSNYTRHLSVHEGEKKYVCNVCSVSYKFQNSLTKHLLSHLDGDDTSVVQGQTVEEYSEDACENLI